MTARATSPRGASASIARRDALALPACRTLVVLVALVAPLLAACGTAGLPRGVTVADELAHLRGARGDDLARLARAEEATGDDRAALGHWLEVAERRPGLRAWAALRLVELTERTPIDAAALARARAVPGLALVAERWALALQDRAALDEARGRLGVRFTWRRSGRLLRWPGTTTSGPVPISRLAGPTAPPPAPAAFSSAAGYIASPEEGPGLYAFALELAPGRHRVLVESDAAMRVFAGDRPVHAHEALEALLPERIAFEVELAAGEALQLHLVSRASVARARVLVDPPSPIADPPELAAPARTPLAAFELALAAADVARAWELVDAVPAAYRDEARARLALADPSRAPERAHAAAKALLVAALAADPRAALVRERLVRLHLEDQEPDAAAGLIAFEDFAARRPDVAALVDPAVASSALAKSPASCAVRVIWLDAEAERLRVARDGVERLAARFDEPLAPLPGPCLDARLRAVDLLAAGHALERAEAMLGPLFALDPGPDRARALATGAALAIARGAWDEAVARATSALAEGGVDDHARELLQRARRLAGGPPAARIDPTTDLGLPLASARPLIDADRKLRPGREGDDRSGREIILDDRRVRVLANGGLIVRAHRIVRVNDVAAVEAIGELPVPDDAEVLLARTWKVGPRGLAALEPEDILEKATISLPDLAPGDYAEWAWFYPIAPSPRLAPGWRAPVVALDSDEGPVARARFTLSLAPGAAPPVFVVDPRIAPPERVDTPTDRRWVFTAEHLGRVFDEPLDPRPEARRRTLVATSGAERLPLADALAAEVAFNLRPTPTLAALADAFTRGAGDDPEARLMALYDRVRADIDEPDDATPFSGEASWVAERKRGSRVLLLAALCRQLGLACEVVLARPLWEGPEPTWPDDGLTYPLVRWNPVGRPARWLDPTGRWMPYALLPPALEGVFGVALGARGGRPSLLETPPADPSRWGERRVRIAIDIGGAGFTATGDEVVDGVFGASWRTALVALTPEGRDKILAAIVQQALPSAVVDEIRLDHLDDDRQPLTWSWRAHGTTTALEGEGGARALVLALFPEGLTQDTVVLPERATPLLVNRAARMTLSATFTAPEGWLFSSAPSDQRLDYELGHFERTSRYEDLGRRVVVDKRFLLRPGVIDPTRYPAWSDAAVAIDRFDLAQVVLAPARKRSP